MNRSWWTRQLALHPIFSIVAALCLTLYVTLAAVNVTAGLPTAITAQQVIDSETMHGYKSNMSGPQTVLTKTVRVIDVPTFDILSAIASCFYVLGLGWGAPAVISGLLAVVSRRPGGIRRVVLGAGAIAGGLAAPVVTNWITACFAITDKFS